MSQKAHAVDSEQPPVQEQDPKQKVIVESAGFGGGKRYQGANDGVWKSKEGEIQFAKKNLFTDGDDNQMINLDFAEFDIGLDENK
jgi:hypothetical protein